MDDTVSQGALGEGMRWVATLLTGSIGVSACVMGVAVLGFLMLFGYLPVRRGAAVIIGCFIILSAEPIGQGVASYPVRKVSTPSAEHALAPVATVLPPYDPYAFASVRQ